MTALFLALSAAVMLLPFLWMVSTALKSNQFVLSLPPRFIPAEPTLESFRRLFSIFPMGRMFFNSLLVTAVAVSGQIATAALAAYAFGRLKFKGRETIFLLYVATLMIPYQVTITPLFILMSKLHLVNTYGGLILPVFTSAFGVFLLRQSFLTLPGALEDSAFIDGATYPQVFFRVCLPLVKPALTTLLVLSFMNVWNSFLWPLIVTRDVEMMTLPVGLQALQGRYTTEWNLVMAGGIITILPIIAIFLFAQTYFIQGMSRSGIK